jgi:hypothetical protein
VTAAKMAAIHMTTSEVTTAVCKQTASEKWTQEKGSAKYHRSRRSF